MIARKVTEDYKNLSPDTDYVIAGVYKASTPKIKLVGDPHYYSISAFKIYDNYGEKILKKDVADVFNMEYVVALIKDYAKKHKLTVDEVIDVLKIQLGGLGYE